MYSVEPTCDFRSNPDLVGQGANKTYTLQISAFTLHTDVRNTSKFRCVESHLHTYSKPGSILGVPYEGFFYDDSDFTHRDSISRFRE